VAGVTFLLASLSEGVTGAAEDDVERRADLVGHVGSHLADEGEALRAWGAANCPYGRVSACVQALFPPEWGDFISMVYRRATPDGERAWDVDLIGTFRAGQGGSGICLYTRVEQGADDVWRVESYAGWIWCGDPASRNMADNPDAPNRAP